MQKTVDDQQGCLKALKHLKDTHPHLKTLISVGGGTASKEFPTVTQNPLARQTLARELRFFCDRYGFDGVDSTFGAADDVCLSLTLSTRSRLGTSEIASRRTGLYSAFAKFTKCSAKRSIPRHHSASGSRVLLEKHQPCSSFPLCRFPQLDELRFYGKLGRRSRASRTAFRKRQRRCFVSSSLAGLWL